MEIPPNDQWNQELIQHVHPSDWKNPEPSDKYNLVVIGGGTAGLVTAAGAAGLGARVALVERYLLGGDCLNYGCVPSKALIRCATAQANVAGAGAYGLSVDGTPSVDFSAVMERMRKLRTQISHHDSAERFSELGVDVFLGDAKFTKPGLIDVAGSQLKYKKAVIATGAKASAPPIPGLDNIEYLTNETLFNLTECPSRLAVIGAGPIGCEMAQTFCRLGADVTLIEVADQILIKEDADAAEVVGKQLETDGVHLALKTKILGMEKESEGISIRYIDGTEDQEKNIKVHAVLVAAGRAPNVKDMGLDAVQVEFDPAKGVKVDDHLKTTNPDIFAAGDVCSKYQFTHAADFMARTVIRNALFPGSSPASALVIPWATYTDPQIAHVGLTEQQAKDENIKIDTYKQPFDGVDRALLDGETDGFVKIHTAKGSDRIVGGTIVARHAGDMIGEVVMAMKHGIGLGKLADVIHPYPTQAEAIRKTGDLYNRTRLTPSTKKWMSRWMAFLRR